MLFSTVRIIVKEFSVFGCVIENKGSLHLERINRSELHRTSEIIAIGNSPAVDGIYGKMLKNGGDVVVEWIT